ncbi:MAG: response regulator [Oscillospiraceae bacterium]|nr:response regulator [Oscillospiraceae bacterium]
MSKLKKYSVLIVDDQKSNIESLKSILSSEYTIYTENKGKNIVKATEKYLPDIVLYGIVTPKTDGYALISELKNSWRTQNIPIILIIEHNLVELDDKWVSSGAVDFITKPFNSIIVKLRIDNYISMFKKLRTTEHEITNYKLASEAMKIALWMMDVVVDDPANLDNKFIWSPEFRSMLGFSNEKDFPNVLRSWYDRLHPDDKEASLKAFETHINDYTGNTPYSIEYRLKNKNGEYRYYDGFGTTLRDGEGLPIRVSGAIRDVTEKKQAQIKLEHREELLLALNETAVTFLSKSEGCFSDAMSESVYPMADATGFHRFSIWRNVEKNGDLCTRQLYKWDSETGGTTTPQPRLQGDISFASLAPGWVEIFKRGESINSPVSLLPEAEMLKSFGVVTAYITPLFINEELWGFGLFEDRKIERYFDENVSEILRSAAYLFANAVIRNEMESEVTKANNRTKILLDKTPLCCQLWDSSFKKIDCNQAAVDLFGFKDKQDYLERYSELYHEFQPDGQRTDEKAIESVRKAFEEGIYKTDWIYKMLDGTSMPTEIILIRVEYEGGVGVAGYTRDLREHKKMMDDINHRDNLLRAVNSTAGVLLTAKNDETFKDSLYESMGIIGRSVNADCVEVWQNMVIKGETHAVIRHYWFNENNQHLESAAAFQSFPYSSTPDWEARLSRGECIKGSLLSLSPEDRAFVKTFGIESLLTIPIFIENRLWGMCCIDDYTKYRDFSEEEVDILRSCGLLFVNALLSNEMIKEIEKQSRELSIQKNTLQTMINSMPDFVFGKDLESKYTLLNHSAAKYLNVDVEEVIGKNDTEGLRFEPEIAEVMISQDKLIYEGMEKYVNNHWIPAYDGSMRYFETTKAPIIQDGVTIGLVGVSRDITEKTEMEKELQSALEKATAASKAKGDFLSVMSHEMRTPMNAIIGMTTIGKKANGEEEKNRAFNKIGDASSHLLGVINDVLDMAKIEANKLEILSVEYNFERLIQKVITFANFRIDEKGQHFTVNIDKKIPTFLVGDDHRLAQVITNLLSNAVKFTPEGGEISLSASLVNKNKDSCELCIEIADNGIGIAQEQHGKLFDMFEQAESGISRKYGGTGLGLVISKRIIELMGGTIRVESELGKGSRFIFTIKSVCGIKNPRSLLAPSVNWDNLQVLVVDDMSDILNHFTDIFNNLGIKCDVAKSGFEACEIIEGNKEHDIYFIDWCMPGMDGIELTKRIKSHIGDRPSVVIMITAMDWEKIKDEAKCAGVDKCLLKPLSSSTIIDAINDCFGVEDAKESENTGDGEFYGKKLLLAEDIEINREILTVLLKETGISIDYAENGKEALDMVEAAPCKYDIVFMDVQMPKMDGLEASRRIRALPESGISELPIIAMTANVFKDDIEACLSAGMNGHIGKPLDIDKVMETLRNYLRVK